MIDIDNMILGLLKNGKIYVEPETGTVFLPRFGGKKSGCKSARGYMVGTFHLGNIRRQLKLHRVVWVAAHGPLRNGLVIDHINRDKTDNRIANLRLVDASGNSQNRRTYRGSENPSAKLDEHQVSDIRKMRLNGKSYAELARLFLVSKSLIAAIIQRKVWT